MQQAGDIVGLYQEFGGEAGSYRELARTQDVIQARARWPLISALADNSAPKAVPAVRQGEDARNLSTGWHAAVRSVPEPAPVHAVPESGLAQPQPMPALVPANAVQADEPELRAADDMPRQSMPQPAVPQPTVPMAQPKAVAAAAACAAEVGQSQPGDGPATVQAKGLAGSSPLAMLLKREPEPEPAAAKPLGLGQLFSQLLGGRS